MGRSPVLIAYLAVGNSTGTATGGIDLVLVYVVLGAIAAGLPSLYYLLKLWDRFRAKSRRQDSEVKRLLQSLIPFFKSYDSGLMQNPWDFLREFKVRKNLIVALDSTLRKRIPKIEKLLTELTDLLGQTYYFKYGFMNLGMPENESNPRFKPLVHELREEIEKWLNKHP